MQPETRYASVGDSQIAYQVFGAGPDLLFLQGFISHIDFRWEEPSLARFLSRLGAFARVITFDRRGSGASDPLPAGEAPTWDVWMEDVNAVLEAVGSERTAIVASNDSGFVAMLFAATHPDRVSSLILTNTGAGGTPDAEYPGGIPDQFREAFLESVESWWGRPDPTFAHVFAPDRANDPEFLRWAARMQRASMTPRRATQMWRLILQMDARQVLPLIRVPTLVVGYRDSAAVPLANAQYLAERIDGAKLLVLEGGGTMTWLNETERYLAAIEEHVTGRYRVVEPDRVLATVLFTDIVRSTERAGELGDRRWRELLDLHDAVSRRTVERFGGRLVKTTGDGVLATFDGPARAIRSTVSLAEELGRRDIAIRAGLHAGEVEVRGDDVGGIALHIAARVMAEAEPGEVLVSSTVKGLVAGSDLRFDDRGVHTLKGIPDEWPLFAVAV